MAILPLFVFFVGCCVFLFGVVLVTFCRSWLSRWRSSKKLVVVSCKSLFVTTVVSPFVSEWLKFGFGIPFILWDIAHALDFLLSISLSLVFLIFYLISYSPFFPSFFHAFFLILICFLLFPNLFFLVLIRDFSFFWPRCRFEFFRTFIS